MQPWHKIPIETTVQWHSYYNTEPPPRYIWKWAPECTTRQNRTLNVIVCSQAITEMPSSRNLKSGDSLFYFMPHRPSEYSGDLVTCTGDWEIGVISRRLPDNPRELAYLLSAHDIPYKYTLTFSFLPHWVIALICNGKDMGWKFTDVLLSVWIHDWYIIQTFNYIIWIYCTQDWANVSLKAGKERQSAEITNWLRFAFLPCYNRKFELPLYNHPIYIRGHILHLKTLLTRIIKHFWETAHLPPPKSTLTLTSHLGKNAALGKG